MPEKPEDFDTLGSNTTLWAQKWQVYGHGDSPDDRCEMKVSFVFLNGMIWLVSECDCGLADQQEELTPERAEGLQDALFNWVAWRQGGN